MNCYFYNQESSQPTREFKLLAQSQAEEDAYDWIDNRPKQKQTAFVGSVAHLVKGALGGGILGGHVAYMKGGLIPSIVFTLFNGTLVGYCMHILVKSANILYKRTRIPELNYSDVGEAAMALFPDKRVAKYSKCFRYTIDVIICIDLFGSCAAYQLIIAKTIKQIVENRAEDTLEGIEGYPGLRVYIAALIIPLIMIAMITHLQWLAPFSLIANCFILFSIGLTVYYSMKENPEMTGLKPYTSFGELVEFFGMSVFSMSCCGVAIPVSNNMKNPNKFPYALLSGMFIIISFVFLISFFGYVGYGENCIAPITLNFPLETMPNILKAAIACMIYATYALNFFIPFHICWHYIQPRINKAHTFLLELVFRASFVIIIGVIAVAFPAISSLMAFLGAFCLSLMAFVWPNMIELLVIWTRPGLGKYKWRLWKCALLMILGIFFFISGSLVNFMEMVADLMPGPDKSHLRSGAYYPGLGEVMKILVVFKIYGTFGLNFYVPFRVCWFYIKPMFKEAHWHRFELFLRAFFVIALCGFTIIVPHFTYSSFLGAFTLSQLIFIIPNIIELLVIWPRPGLGKYKWRLWKSLAIILFGFILFSFGFVIESKTFVKELKHMFT